ncbi:MAG: argininosuccinate lyase [Bacteroidales bacterium]|jgi:argininosuccinate lyase|nr:argininosuccinate lyase [Bacteroidales bacterium]
MHLWDKGGSTRASIISFTCSDDRRYDARMAPWDIVGSMAHAIMLVRCGLITAGEGEQLLAGLTVLYEESQSPDFALGQDYEDIHTYVELRLSDLAGEAAGKLHTGRSRNDQVLTDIHLYVRDQSFMLAQEIRKLAIILLDLSEKHERVLMPGFTHLQAAMVSSFGLWFASYAESICDDLQALSGATSFADASPLGTAAGYGTSLPIDRELTASLLGFGRLIVTSPYAQMSRGRMERQITAAIASAANTLARFASDVILFMSPGYRFISLSDDLTTGSSIMPQKKNPDLFELIRARSNRLQAIPGEVALMTAGLPPGYNRDYQELKAVVFDAFDGIIELVKVMQDAVTGLEINRDILKDLKYNDIFSAEEANDLVRGGMPFREAYRAVAGKAGSGLYRVPDASGYSHTGSIGNRGTGIIKERLEMLMTGFKSGCTAEDLFEKIRGMEY